MRWVVTGKGMQSGGVTMKVYLYRFVSPTVSRWSWTATKGKAMIFADDADAAAAALEVNGGVEEFGE